MSLELTVAVLLISHLAVGYAGWRAHARSLRGKWDASDDGDAVRKWTQQADKTARRFKIDYRLGVPREEMAAPQDSTIPKPQRKGTKRK